MKLPLKYIALLVILSLTGVFAYQTYWLTNLYRTQRSQMERNIREAMRMSDYNEMIVRVRRLQNDSSVQAEVTVSTGYDNERAFTKTHTIRSVKQGDSTRISIWERDASDTTRTPQAALQANMASILFEKKNSTAELASNFQQGLHAGMDLLNEPDFAVFDSLLRRELHRIGIDAPYRLMYLHRGSIVDSSYTFTDTLAVEGTAGYRPSPQAVTYSYSYDMHGHWNYLLILEPTESLVLAQMAGILTASALILAILGLSFGFLIRTLLRQKTLEEMTSDFTNNITHELKTPIAVAYAASDALLNFDSGTAQLRLRNRPGETRTLPAHLPGTITETERAGGTDTRHVNGTAQDFPPASGNLHPSGSHHAPHRAAQVEGGQTRRHYPPHRAGEPHRIRRPHAFQQHREQPAGQRREVFARRGTD